METLAMFLFLYKLVVEFKKVGTVILFLQPAPFIFILLVCMSQEMLFLILLFFSCDSYSLLWLDISSASLPHGGKFLSFHN